MHTFNKPLNKVGVIITTKECCSVGWSNIFNEAHLIIHESRKQQRHIVLTENVL